MHFNNLWHISRFPGHVSIIGNRFSVVIWPISTSCMLISQRITFTPRCHDFYARDSQHYKLMEWKEIGQSAHTRRQRIAAVPDASTENTSRCGLSVLDEPDAVCTRAIRRVPFTLGKNGSVNTACCQFSTFVSVL